jgi:hypothetical protein
MQGHAAVLHLSAFPGYFEAEKMIINGVPEAARRRF